jgi:hypothetical protein
MKLVERKGLQIPTLHGSPLGFSLSDPSDDPHERLNLPDVTLKE